MMEIRGTTMGTTYMVKVVKNDRLSAMSPAAAEETVTADIETVLNKVNSQMSTWIEDSELSRFNRFDRPEWFDVSMDTVIVFAEALRVSRVSGGAFDITVGPIINLWGFGSAKIERHIPTDEQIKEVMAKTGYQKLSVRQVPPAVKKENPDINCSLAAIAKGFGVDKVASYLESKEIFNYVVEIGGEVRVRGMRPDGSNWRIGIATPDGSPSYGKVVLLKDVSMATSGDYHNYFEENGVRYSHTIDPTTGRPITHNLASVSVVNEFCMTADALATAIDVLGPDKGYELAIKEHLPVFLILKGKDGFVEKMTPQFRKLLNKGE
jgi:thiamine biosynthesis lipoprotein